MSEISVCGTGTHDSAEHHEKDASPDKQKKIERFEKMTVEGGKKAREAGPV